VGLTSKQKLALLALAAVVETDPFVLNLAGPTGGGSISGMGGAGNIPKTPSAGGTIADAAKQATEGAAHKFAPGAGGGFGHNAHVRTAQGAKLFKEPIGALIIAHPHAMQTPHSSGAKDAKLVQAGNKNFSVPQDAHVHIPRHVDVNDESAVKRSDKIVQHGDFHQMLRGNGEVGPLHQTPDAKRKFGLSDDYKPLPAQHIKKPVHFGSSQSHWVPSNWTVYKGAGKSEESLGSKFAKDPDGNWYMLPKDGGPAKPMLNSKNKLDGWASKGLIEEDEEKGLSKSAVLPSDQPGPHEPKVDVGGVAVTKQQILDAIKVLNDSKATNVKLPLKHAGHVLQDMDYMGVSDAELKAHPELKVPQGTKKQHVGKVKNAVLHHLAGKLDELSKNEAEEKVAQHAEEKAQAVAAHAQKLAGATFDWGGVQASKEQLEQARTILEETADSHSSFKQALLKKGNPLAGADYMGVAKQHKKDFPNATKGMNTKQILAHHLTMHMEQLAQADQESGHDDSAELHALVSDAAVKPNWEINGHGAAAKALADAYENDKPVYAFKEGPNGPWTTGMNLPEGKSGYKATPEHQLFIATLGGGEGQLSEGKTMGIANTWLTPKEHAPEVKPEPVKKTPKPTVNDLLKKVMDNVTVPPKEEVEPQLKWKESDEFKDLDSLLKGTAASQVPLNASKHTDEYLTSALWLASAVHQDRFLSPDSDTGSWKIEKHQPIPGSYGATTPAGWYQVTADHRVWHYDKDGSSMEQPSDVLLQIIKDNISHEEPDEPEPKQAETIGTGKFSETFTLKGHHYSAPKGSGAFWSKIHGENNDDLWIRHPDGQWVIFPGEEDEKVDKLNLGNKVAEKYVASGKFEAANDAAKVYQTGVQTVTPAPEEQQPGEDFKVGSAKYTAPEGTASFKSPQGGALFLRKPNGDWVLMDGDTGTVDEKSFNTGKSAEQNVTSGYFTPDNPAAKGYAEKVQAVEVQHENAFWDAQEGEPEAGAKTPKPTDISIKVHGQEVGTEPEGSKVYWYPGVADKKADQAGTKYVNSPDGNWHVYDKTGKLHDADGGGTYSSYMGQGKFKLENPAADDAQVLDDAPKIPALYGNKIVGEVPAGTKFFTKEKSQYENFGQPYYKFPDGTWHKSQGYGVSKVYGDLQEMVDDGKLIPADPPDDETIAHLSKVASFMNQFPVSTAKPGKSGDTPWEAFAKKLTTPGNNNNLMVSKAANGKYLETGYPKDGEEHWYLNYEAMEVQHTAADGTKTDIPADEVMQKIGEHMTPDSVIVNGAQHKFGIYYKPKSKAYVEIKPYTSTAYYGGYNDKWKYGQAAKALYVYHAQNGNVKDVTPTYAAKSLEGAELHDSPPDTTPKPGAKGGKAAPKYAAVAQGGGKYQLWSKITNSVAEDQSWDLHDDGSSLLYGAKGAELPIPSHGADGENLTENLLKSGTVLDQFGTTVVKPGVTPKTYHVLGSTEMTKENLQTLLSALEEGFSDNYAIKLALANHLTSFSPPSSKNQVSQSASKFWSAKVQGGGFEGQRDALMGLLRELMQIPELPHDLDLSGKVEPSFLKGLPPGIHTPKDVFKFGASGYAAPFTGSISKVVMMGSKPYMTPLDDLDSPTLADKIKAISAQFGDSKVVGTHPAALNKAQKIKWLNAWQQGDMKTVFELDASGGKVSTVHPGAPENTGTHHVDWAPYDESQVPASKGVEGDWSDHEKVTLPIAEVHNYLIKAGLQNAQYLAPLEQRSWVVAHRSHQQEVVDALTAKADERKANGDPPITNPLEWTDGLKPATSYDSYLTEKKSAFSWPQQAQIDFFQDHADNLAPYVAKWKENQGYNPDYIVPTYYYDNIIQTWQDGEQEKYLAEQSKPVWSLTPGAKPVQSSHPIYDLTAKVPLTQDVSRWFFKPAPSHEKFLAEQEDMANKLGQAWGFKTPSSQLLEFDGKYGQAQVKLSPEGDLTFGQSLGFYDPPPLQWDKLSQREVSDIAREHILDWALDNDDGRASNFLRMPDGSVVGIDKGRAWANFGVWNGLAGDYQADERSAQVSTALYDAIRSHSVSKELADKAFLDVMQRAGKMERLSDGRMTSMLEQAFASRTKFGAPGSKEALIQAAIDRKNSLSKDFQDLWSRVYQDAGWELPEIPESKLPETLSGNKIHSGFSDPDFWDSVHDAKSKGKFAFFAGTNLEEGGFLVWHELAGKGTDAHVVRGESSMRGTEYDHVLEWLQAQEPSTFVSEDGVPTSVGGNLGNVHGEKDWFDKLVGGGKTISHHAVDQQFNAGKLSEMQFAKTAIEARLKEAEEAKAKGGGTLKAFELNWGPADANIDAAKHYMDLYTKIIQAKDNHGTFVPGDLPRWEPPKVKPDEKAQSGAAKVKVELAYPDRPLGQATSEGLGGLPGTIGQDGELHTSTSGAKAEGGGKVWKVTLPTGETIEIGNSNYHGVPLAHHGRIRFKAKHEDGEASLERIRSQLQNMGLSMEDAQEHDMELFYWRHLANILADRTDRMSGKYKKVWETLEHNASAHGVAWHQTDLAANVEAFAKANLSPDEEIALYREAWGHVTSPEQVQQFVEDGGHLPHFTHGNVFAKDLEVGKPFWYRFDMTDPEWLAKQQMPGHSFQGDSSTDAEYLISSGGLMSKETRLRALGLSVSGMDNPASTGATGYVYTRLNMEGNNFHVFMSPKVLARTTNYSYGEDNYGKIQYRKDNAYFDKSGWSGYHGGGNETMIKDMVSLLDDVELLKVYNPQQRKKIIDFLKSQGVETIRGLPVEQRVVESIGAKEIATVKANWAEHPEYLDPMAAPGAGLWQSRMKLSRSGRPGLTRIFRKA
jgi:hypothetical protein